MRAAKILSQNMDDSPLSFGLLAEPVAATSAELSAKKFSKLFIIGSGNSDSNLDLSASL